MAAAPPIAIMLAGPNGAGKTTTAMTMFRESVQKVEYVNADVLAQGLSGGNPDSVAIQAGAIMLDRLRQLADGRKDLAFETTGASRSFAAWLKKLKLIGYEFHLFFFWLRSADAAVARVAERVQMGGHNVPAETIHRRYELGLHNFFHLYRPIATQWQIFDNNAVAMPRLVACGGEALETVVEDGMLWDELVKRYA